MSCEKATELIKEASRNRDNITLYNSDLVEQIGKEICAAIQDNHADAQANVDRPSGSISLLPTIRIRHLSIQRNQRCLMAYHHHRLKNLRNMRWEFGSLLPPEIKANLSHSEATWFSEYSTCLAKYMRGIGSFGGVNLCVDLKPPKSLYIEVKCLVDYGKHQLNDGSVILLKKDSRYYLPRSECEEFIRLHIFEHIV